MNEEQIRVGFEAWFLTYSVPADPTELAKDKDGYYLYDPAFFAWEGWKAAIASQPTVDRVRELENKYNELIMAVACKFPDETRHDTALRYIRNAEAPAIAVLGQSMKGGTE